MKRTISLLILCLLILGINADGYALATLVDESVETLVYIEPHASDFLASYSANTSRASSGRLRIEFTVNATRRFQNVGAALIVIQERSGDTWTTVRNIINLPSNNMMAHNTDVHGGTIFFNGTAGREYRALVTVFAGNVTGDQRTITTNSTIV